jgi:transcriptional regulator with XRE-family HTH domain
MNSSFPAILSKLRHDKHVNQRTAAAALNISQALLSHYENGLREPGLDFIDSACDYYNVSADYLLGRSAINAPLTAAVSTGAMTDFSELLAAGLTELYHGINSCSSPEAGEAVTSILSVFFYSLMRHYDKDGSFDIPEPLYQALCDASIKAQLARLHSLGNECKLSFTVPAQIKKAAEDELNAIINDWK